MPPAVELINVSKRFGRRIVFANLNMSIEAGEMVAIMGKSGAGKTTLLNIIGLLEKADGGHIKLFGKPSPPIGTAQATRLLREKIGFLFQNFALIDDETVDYNLEIPLIYAKKTRKEKQELKIAALRRVGLDIDLKRRVYELSGGEQQRVAIARILLKPCGLILADEPTGSLDAENRNEVLRLLKEFNQAGKTILIVTHDEYVARRCNRVVKLG